MSNKAGVQQSAGTGLKNYFYLLLLSKIFEKVQFFKFPLWDFDDIFIGRYPHM